MEYFLSESCKECPWNEDTIGIGYLCIGLKADKVTTIPQCKFSNLERIDLLLNVNMLWYPGTSHLSQWLRLWSMYLTREGLRNLREKND